MDKKQERDFSREDLEKRIDLFNENGWGIHLDESCFCVYDPEGKIWFEKSIDSLLKKEKFSEQTLLAKELIELYVTYSLRYPCTGKYLKIPGFSYDYLLQQN